MPDGDANMGTRLLCLRHAHKQGLLGDESERENKWRGLVSYELLTAAVCHSDEEVSQSFHDYVTGWTLTGETVDSS